MRQLRVPWWLLVGLTTFLGYFALLVYCDLRRPESEQFAYRFDGPRMVLTEVPADSPSRRAGFKAGDELVAWNGQPIQSRLDWQAIEANYVVGRAMRFTVVRDGARIDVVFAPEPESWRYFLTRPGFSLLFVRAAQLVTLAFAVIVALRRPRDPVALIGAWLLASAGVLCVALPYRFAAVWRALPIPIGAALWLPFVSTLVLPAILWTFFELFPRPTPRSAARWAVAWLPMAGIVGVHLVHAVRMVYTPHDMTRTPEVILGVLLVGAGYVVVTAVRLIRSYRRLDDANERRRVRVVVMGSTIGCLTAVPLIAAFWLSSTQPLFFASTLFTVGTFVILAVPLSFTYAILRHRMFDVRLIVRRGVQYALARWSLRMLVPAAGLVFAVDLWVNRAEPISSMLRSRLWAYVVLVGFAVIAQSRRQRWLDALDRRFFRERFDARRLLGAVVDDIRTTGSVDRVAPRVVGRIEAALHPEFVALLARKAAEPSYGVIAAAPAGVPIEPIGSGTTVVGLLRALGKPLEVSAAETNWLSARLPDDERSLLRRTRIDLLVPVAVGPDSAETMLALGPKRSEEPYGAEDLELLSVVAGALALVVDRPSPPPAAPERFEECPDCGSCYAVGTSRCQTEGAALVASVVPRVLNGRYRLERRLGRGGMGTVYEATDTALDRRVAVKLVRDELVGDAQARERFRREARVAAGFAHPNVVTVHDFGVADGTHAYLVMELLQGSSLRLELAAARRLDPQRTVGILAGVGAAVDAAHQLGLVHRDLKPENVQLVRSAGGEVAKVVDFGIAKALPTPGGLLDGRSTEVGAFIGTPLYMAPEQLRGEEASPSWDLWALGVMAHEMLVGTHPFAGAAVTGRMAGQPNPLASPALAAFFARALALDPPDRPGSGRSLVAELERALGPGAAESS